MQREGGKTLGRSKILLAAIAGGKSGAKEVSDQRSEEKRGGTMEGWAATVTAVEQSGC